MKATKSEAQAPIFESQSSSQSASQNLILLPTLPQSDDKGKKEAKKVIKTETVFPEQPQPHPQKLSIDQLTDKADRVYLLRKKYEEIRDKRKQLEKFAISHDSNNAQLTLVDANELTISTSNPVAIGKLLADWMCDLNTGLEKTESEIRRELEGLN